DVVVAALALAVVERQVAVGPVGVGVEALPVLVVVGTGRRAGDGGRVVGAPDVGGVLVVGGVADIEARAAGNERNGVELGAVAERVADGLGGIAEVVLVDRVEDLLPAVRVARLLGAPEAIAEEGGVHRVRV